MHARAIEVLREAAARLRSIADVREGEYHAGDNVEEAHRESVRLATAMRADADAIDASRLALENAGARAGKARKSAERGSHQ